ncbi:MAG: metallophosphoesterase [Armatimonadetes bacterium]|nr:metallophosphoesterase [Armatimonadota bacterium]
MDKVTRRKILKVSGLGILGLGLSQFGEATRLQLNRQTLHLPKWDADGFRVALLSDFHVNTPADVALTREAMEMALAAKPDLIAIPGDFYDEDSLVNIPRLAKALEGFASRGIPIVGTMGNHDYWSNPSEVIQTVRSSGIRLLRNETFEHHGVVIAGIDDGLVNRDRHDFLGLRGEAGSVLSLFHEPDFCTRVDNRVSLMMAGHSHGGQVCLPFGKSLHTPRGAKKYISGYYPDAAIPLFVSNGVGCTGLSVRAFCRPEVCLLTLRGQ